MRRGLHLLRLAAEEILREADVVHADVVQRAATGLAPCADVVGMVVMAAGEKARLHHAQIAQSGKFVTGDLTIDYDKHQVLMNGQNAGLTVNEYKIVALLGKYAGKVLTYDFIIRELWGPKAKTDNQILRVNMANIRRKIEPTPGNPQYIFTEVGVGYRMREGD